LLDNGGFWRHGLWQPGDFWAAFLGLQLAWQQRVLKDRIRA